MNKWIAGLAAGLMVLASTGLAADDAAQRKAAADELLKAMKTPEMMANAFSSLKQKLPLQMKQIAASTGETNMPPEAAAYMQKMTDMMAEEFSWDKMKNDFIALYADTFTVDEMKGITAFYQSPAGRVFVEKQPELMSRSMELTQTIMMRVMPRIKAMSDEMAAEMKAKAAAAPVPVPAPKAVEPPVK